MQITNTVPFIVHIHSILQVQNIHSNSQAISIIENEQNYIAKIDVERLKSLHVPPIFQGDYATNNI